MSLYCLISSVLSVKVHMKMDTRQMPPPLFDEGGGMHAAENLSYICFN